MRSLRGHGRTPDREDVPLAGVVLGVEAEHHLDLDRAGEGHPQGRKRIAPDEDAGIALGACVAPLEFKHEILVHAIGAQDADGLSRATKHAGFGSPGVFGTVDVHPSVEVLPLNRGLKSVSCSSRARKEP